MNEQLEEVPVLRAARRARGDGAPRASRGNPGRVAANKRAADAGLAALGEWRAAQTDAHARLATQVEHMPQTLRLPTDQIVVEGDLLPEGGDEPEARLTLVLSDHKAQHAKHRKTAEAHKAQLQQAQLDLADRAHVSTEGEVKAHETWLKAVQAKLDADAKSGVDLVAIKAGADHNAAALKAVRDELAKKPNAADVDDKVEFRYQEVLRHLVETLKVTVADEDDFRRAVAELRDELEATAGARPTTATSRRCARSSPRRSRRRRRRRRPPRRAAGARTRRAAARRRRHAADACRRDGRQSEPRRAAEALATQLGAALERLAGGEPGELGELGEPGEASAAPTRGAARRRARGRGRGRGRRRGPRATASPSRPARARRARRSTVRAPRRRRLAAQACCRRAAEQPARAYLGPRQQPRARARARRARTKARAAAAVRAPS